MWLEGFRVKMYRSVRDSGPVPVFPLTALVGRQRSGKTSLLSALAGLDVRVARPYGLESDWPRGSRQPRSSEHVVCSASFCLGDPQAGPGGEVAGPLEERRLQVERTYAGELRIEERTRGGPRGEGSTEGARGTPMESLRSYVQEHMPRFLLAEHDRLLPGAVTGNALAAPGVEEEQLGIAALARLMGAAGVSMEETEYGLGSRKVRECGEQIRAVFRERGFLPGFQLDVDRGRIVVSVEHAGVRTRADRLPEDERFRLTVELRLAASALETGRNTVLLLDGPGQAFRRKARARMRGLLDHYACGGVTVIYTARMPFEIELQHSEQVLVLSPEREGAMVDPCEGGAESKLAVRAALGMTGRTSFTVDDLNLVVEGSSDARVLRALDRLWVRAGEPGLPAELTLTSAQGAEEVAAVSTFLGRQGLGVIALFDSDPAGSTARHHLQQAAREHPRIERLAVLQLADAAGLPTSDAAIEDLFPQDDYMQAVRAVCGRSVEGLVARAAREDEGNPAAHLSRVFQEHGRRFPKGRVIEQLVERIDSMASVDELPEGMMGPVERLMEAIRSAVDGLQGKSGEGGRQ